MVGVDAAAENIEAAKAHASVDVVPFLNKTKVGSLEYRHGTAGNSPNSSFEN